MDPIKNMMSGADPLNRDTSEEPDGESALRRMLTEPVAFSDSRPPNVATLEEVRRRRRARRAGLAGIAAAAVTVGVLVATNLGSLTSAPAPAGTAEPTATATAPATGTATPTPMPSAASSAALAVPDGPTPAPAAWLSYTDATGQASFDIKEGWSVQTVVRSGPGSDQPPFISLDVHNSANALIAKLDLVYDAAMGTCADPKPFAILDSVDLDIPQKPNKVKEFSEYKGLPWGPSRFTYTIIEGDSVFGSVALSEDRSVKEPLICTYTNGIIAPTGVPFAYFGDVNYLEADGSNAPLAFDSVAEAKAYMTTQDYLDLKRMLISLELWPMK
ncbi:MAG: hypothetical protein ABIO34_04335 [Arthrobacter oryzae]